MQLAMPRFSIDSGEFIPAPALLRSLVDETDSLNADEGRLSQYALLMWLSYRQSLELKFQTISIRSSYSAPGDSKDRPAKIREDSPKTLRRLSKHSPKTLSKIPARR